MTNSDFIKVITALFKTSHLTHSAGGRYFGLSLNDVVDILSLYVDQPAKVILDTENRSLHFEEQIQE